jgi:hypothetical protein
VWRPAWSDGKLKEMREVGSIEHPPPGRRNTSYLISRTTREGRFAAVIDWNMVALFETRVLEGSDQIDIRSAGSRFEYGSYVTSLDLSPDGCWLAFGGPGEEAPEVIHVSTEVRQEIGNMGNGAKSVRFSSDSHCLLVGSYSRYALLRRQGDEWGELQEFPSGISYPRAVFSNDGSMLAMHRDGHVDLRTAPHFELAAVLKDPYRRTIQDLRFGPRDRDLFVAGEHGIRRWKLSTLRQELARYGLDWFESK